jgi:hypothetical protein
MTSRSIAGLAAAAVALVAIQAGSAAPLTTYADATGDSGTAADITSITVTNDDAGTLTFKLSIANRPAALNADDLIGFGIDSDRNAQTGDSDGVEYLLLIGSTGSGIIKWDGTDYVAYTHGPVSGSYAAGVVQLSIGKADIGGGAAFDFYAVAFAGDETTAADDLAPENGIYTYTLTAPVKVDAADAFFTPAAPKAGALFGVSRVVVYLTDKSSARVAAYSCTAKLAGKALKPVSRCKWRLPATAKGKKLVVTVSLVYKGEGGTITPYAFKVR